MFLPSCDVSKCFLVFGWIIPGSAFMLSWLSPLWTCLRSICPLPIQITILWDRVQFSHSVMSDSVTPWIAACQASLSITNFQSLLKLMSIESVMVSSHLILCRLLLLPPSIFPSIRVFSNESVLCIRWPNYWSFSFNISPSNKYSGLTSFRIDWLDLLAVQIFSNATVQKHPFFGTQLFL